MGCAVQTYFQIFIFIRTNYPILFFFNTELSILFDSIRFSTNGRTKPLSRSKRFLLPLTIKFLVGLLEILVLRLPAAQEHHTVRQRLVLKSTPPEFRIVRYDYGSSYNKAREDGWGWPSQGQLSVIGWFHSWTFACFIVGLFGFWFWCNFFFSNPFVSPSGFHLIVTQLDLISLWCSHAS